MGKKVEELLFCMIYHRFKSYLKSKGVHKVYILGVHFKGVL